MKSTTKRSRACLRGIIAVGLAVLPQWLFLAASAEEQPQKQRIVSVGDSITDGHTYPQLVRQALEEAGKPIPVCINAAMAGDTAQGMRKRLQRDVLPHQPTLVTFSAGINDVLRGVKLADYEADVTAIAEQLHKEKVPLLILTTSILGPKHAEADRKLADYNAILHRIAARSDSRVAEVNALFQQARGAGRTVLEEDQVHPNYEGQQLIARAILDALGFKDVAVPRELKLEVLPGVVREWLLRPVADREAPLEEKSVAALMPDETWKKYTLPEQEPQPTWWLDHERRRGFALSLSKRVVQGKSYQGIAVVQADKPRQVFFNTGAQLQTIWLNGKRIYQGQGWTGWHAGKERIAAQLRTGENRIVIETGSQFFLSMTEKNDW